MLCAFGVSIQQLPPQESLPKSQQETVPPAVAPPLSVPVEDYTNDPLFLEIKKIVQQGSTPSAAVAPSNTQTDSVSNSRWHAVESILAAARMLEQDVAESMHAEHQATQGTLPSVLDSFLIHSPRFPAKRGSESGLRLPLSLLEIDTRSIDSWFHLIQFESSYGIETGAMRCRLFDQRRLERYVLAGNAGRTHSQTPSVQWR